MKFYSIAFCLLVSFYVNAQNLGSIKGEVVDAQTRIAIADASILVKGTTIGVSTNEKGKFNLKNVPLGYIKVQVSNIGYQTFVTEAYLVTKDKIPYIKIVLQEEQQKLEEVVISKKQFTKKIENPISAQSLGIVEIEKNPGGNRDVLKVIQSLPGVASNPGFRNDIIIRGGSPSENSFYLDGIEVPVINHFQTQGSSGGPVGIINADLIRKVDFYTSSFSANRANALSSVVEFTQKEGNPEKWDVRATLGTSDAGITVGGPLSKNTTILASARQSYLQYLFKVIKLPFLPTYNDFQLNIKHKLSPKSEIALIGLGAIDKFKLNKTVNRNIEDAKVIKRNSYILANIPIQEQWNYTLGASYKHYSKNSFQQLVLSRNEWSNTAKKYFNNTNALQDLLLDYNSKEIENKLRFENTTTLKKGYKTNIGVGVESAKYTNTTFQKIANANGVTKVNFSSKLTMLKYHMFGQVSKKFLNYKLGVSLGFRVDGVNYNKHMQNIFNQFSPRVALSYKATNKLQLNASYGRYFQLPSYTIMGYRNDANELVNKINGLKYIKATHYVTGVELNPSNTFKISVEGFYKLYANYPFSVRDKISLANLGADFGVIGNEEVTSTSAGRAYGLELLAQKKSYSGLYGILSYTLVRSEFKDKNNKYTPSSWDNKHLLTLTAGKKLAKHWEIGAKFRLVGGQPYTPYDKENSAYIENYNVKNSGILDYNKLNTKRFNAYHQLDVRVDKTWYWNTFSLNVYLDIQNVYGKRAISQTYLTPLLDKNGAKVIDTQNSLKYKLEELENSSGTILPRFGVIIDF